MASIASRRCPFREPCSLAPLARWDIGCQVDPVTWPTDDSAEDVGTLIDVEPVDGAVRASLTRPSSQVTCLSARGAAPVAQTDA